MVDVDVKVLNTKNIGGIAVQLVEYSNGDYAVEFNQKPVMIGDISLVSAEYAAIPGGSKSFPGGYTIYSRPQKKQASGSTSITASGNLPAWMTNPDPFQNTEAWVSKYFKKYYDDIQVPRFIPGYRITKINGIVQRANPSPTQLSPNENTYQWDVSYDFTGPTTGTWEETLYFKTASPWYIFDSTSESKFVMSIGRAGSLAVGASGFTPLAEEEGINEDAVRIVHLGYFGGSTTSEYKAYDVEMRSDGYYTILYLPGDPENVYQVLGPFDTKEQAVDAGQAHVAAYTVDVINDEREDFREENAEAGQEAMRDINDSGDGGDLGTVSGNIPDKPVGFKYELADFSSWQQLIDDGILVNVDITGSISGKRIDLAGTPLFGYQSAGAYGFDKCLFEVAMGYKLTFDLDCEDFDIKGESWYSFDQVDFSLEVIMEGGDTFEIDMGDRTTPAYLSIILDGMEKSPYEASGESITVDREAQLNLKSLSKLVSTTPEGFPEDGNVGGTEIDDIIDDLNPTLPEDDDNVKPDPKPDDDDPFKDDEEDEDEGSSDTSAFASLGMAALLGLVAVIAIVALGRRSDE